MEKERAPLLSETDDSDDAEIALDYDLKEQARPPVPEWRKILFGVGNIGRGLMIVIINVFLSTFLFEVARVSSFYIGLMLILGQIYDALTDPVLAAISDNWYTRFGRRKPWILASAIPIGLVWILLWSSPALFNLRANSGYGTFLPRENLSCFMIAGFSSSVWSALIILLVVSEPTADGGMEEVPNYPKGYMLAALITAPIIMLFNIVAGVTGKERIPSDEEMSRIKAEKKGLKAVSKKFFRDIGKILSNPPFLMVSALNLFAQAASTFNTVNLYFWAKYVLEKEADIKWILLSSQIGIVVGFFAAVLLVRFTSKETAYIILAALNGLQSLILFFANEQVALWIILVLVFLGGFFTAGGFLVPQAMLPDVIELDERMWNVRREAMFYSVFLLMLKGAQALTQASSAWSLGLAGYEAPPDSEGEDGGIPDEQTLQSFNEEQPTAVLWTLRVLYTIIPMIFQVSAIIVLLFYPRVLRKYEFRVESEGYHRSTTVISKGDRPEDKEDGDDISALYGGGDFVYDDRKVE